LTRGFGSETNPRDGDRVKIEVDLEGGVVMEARVSTVGCEVSTKASSALMRLTRGRARSEALAINAFDLIAQLGPLEEHREPCVATVIGAFRAAIVDAHVKATA
jgi:NifU-like protein involved in Fe-S cluster formation